jgi:predicted transcriptional regulator
MRKKQTTPLELQIMQVLWETGPAPVQVVQERLAGERPLSLEGRHDVPPPGPPAILERQG